jgi:hypothetical protein
MANEIPVFILTCIKSDYPAHLVPGCRYKIDVTSKSKDGKEISVFWIEPVELKWVFIGFFPLSCFDNAPIKKWINEKKGIVETPKPAVRERMIIKAPVVRERVIIRSRVWK